MKPHKHAELIKAWADGREIEVFNEGNNCWEVCTPGWYGSVKYRLRDPYRELKAAAADPTKQVRCKEIGNWAEANSSWEWCFPPEEYEIRDKPVEKVKLLAYLTQHELVLLREGAYFDSDWIRVPSEDKEVEVEE